MSFGFFTINIEQIQHIDLTVDSFTRKELHVKMFSS